MSTSDEKEHGEMDHTERYRPVEGGSTKVAQEMCDQGLLWLVNRVLHPFGYALGVDAMVEGGEVKGVLLCKTDDFEGIVYGDGEEGMTGRRKLLNWLARGMKR